LGSASPADARDAFIRDLRLSQAAVRRGVVPGSQAKADKHWQVWEAFCMEHGIDPLLEHVRDPIPCLQVFATRYRRRLGPTGLPVRSGGTVSDAIRLVGQTMASMGARDARTDTTGMLDFRLSRQFRSYTREDPPPTRVKPIPISLICKIAQSTTAGAPSTCAIANMIVLGFFFLLCPGEYTGSNNDDTPFRSLDVQLFIGPQRINFHLTPDQIHAATSVSLTFTTQKNGVRGEVVNHGRSGHPTLCPVLAACRRLEHLLAHQVPPTTVLAAYYEAENLRLVAARDVTLALRNDVALVCLGPPLRVLRHRCQCLFPLSWWHHGPLQLAC